DVKKWCRWGANLGLQSRNFPMVDIDCDQSDLAQKVEDLAIECLGPAPVRGRDGSAHRLLLYALAEGSLPIRKGRIEWADANGREGAVDILGKGQQACLEGGHPKGGHYRWRNNVGACEWGREKLVPITVDLIVEFLQRLKALLLAEGCTI